MVSGLITGWSLSLKSGRNQGGWKIVEIVKEKSKDLRKERSQEKVREFLQVDPNAKVLPLLRFSFIMSVSAKMPNRSHGKLSEAGRSQGKVRENESREKVATLYN